MTTLPQVVTKPEESGERYTLHLGDCLDVLKGLPDASVDAVVTDPPYGLTSGSGERGFMGAAWDARVPGCEYWREVLRVAKPGAHLLAFGGTRTFHRLAVAIEDAGWEIRDCIGWLHGQGFPKSLDVSKQIDKEAGIVGELIGERRFGKTSTGQGAGWNTNAIAALGRQDMFAPATDAAKQWNGWGTAVKPAWEPIILARKPLAKGLTVAANVQTHGTGAINVEACRIPSEADFAKYWDRNQSQSAENGVHAMNGGLKTIDLSGYAPSGRWPANVILDEHAAAELDRQSGTLISGKPCGFRKADSSFRSTEHGHALTGYGDSGGASRFFYCAKPSTSERNAGCDHLSNGNNHPTLKSISLMRYLARLVCPRDGVVLDPFMGSGTTGVACVHEGFRFIGIEREPEYLDISRARIAHASGMPAQPPVSTGEAQNEPTRPQPPKMLSLFDSVEGAAQ